MKNYKLHFKSIGTGNARSLVVTSALAGFPFYGGFMQAINNLPVDLSASITKTKKSTTVIPMFTLFELGSQIAAIPVMGFNVSGNTLDEIEADGTPSISLETIFNHVVFQDATNSVLIMINCHNRGDFKEQFRIERDTTVEYEAN